MITAGIDVGSTYTKAVLLDGDGKLLGKGIINTGFRLAEAATSAYQDALAEAGIAQDDVRYVVSTGYGRFQVPFRDVQVTDLSAQARGACYFYPNTKTVLDVGGHQRGVALLRQGGDDDLAFTNTLQGAFETVLHNG